MTEELDLNAIAKRKREWVEKKPKKTKEEQIKELTAEIAELEEMIKGPTDLESFLATSREEQEAALDLLHHAHPETRESVPSLEKYIEFTYGAVKDMSRLKLAAAKLRLDALQNDLE